jgi:predicted O-methyltransferase YrrM
MLPLRNELTLPAPVSRFLKDSRQRVITPWRAHVFNDAASLGLPDEVRSAFAFIAAGQLSHDTALIRSKVEGLRAELAQQDAHVVFRYDARPVNERGGFGDNERPGPGVEKRVSFAEVAGVLSVSPRWGTFLHECARSVNARSILELGCAAGISSCYLALVPSCKQFFAIDASADMLALARQNLRRSGAAAEVALVQALFDDGLDQLFADESLRFDFVWIDGHHERDATLHYFQRILPRLRSGALVGFDDIRWSPDMYEAWQTLQKWPGFRHTVDAAKVGIGIWQGDGIEPRFWDMTKACPRAPIGRPKGIA